MTHRLEGAYVYFCDDNNLKRGNSDNYTLADERANLVALARVVYERIGKIDQQIARTMQEREYAIMWANKILERIHADPDDDLSVLARQLIRMNEKPAV